jgi:hypothetical protein
MSALKDLVADYCAEHGLGWEEAVAELELLWSRNSEEGGTSSDDNDEVPWPPIQEGGVLICR